MSSTHSRRRPSRFPARSAVVEAVEGRVLLTTVTINGTAGNDTIAFDANSYTVNGVKTFINATATTEVVINAGDGADTIRINKNKATHAIQANGGDGFDTFFIGAGKLNTNVPGKVFFDGGAFGEDKVVVDDSLNTADGDTMSLDAFDFGSGTRHEFFGIAQWEFKLGSGDDAFFLNRLDFGANLLVNGGAGDEFFDIGAGNLDVNLQGFSKFVGGPGTDDLDLNDFNAGNGLDVTISPGRFKSAFAPAIDFAECESMNINCSDNGDVIHAQTATLGFSVDLAGGENFVQGSTKADLIQGGDDADSLEGGGGNDTIEGNGGDDTLLGGPGNDNLDGGDGKDTLDGGEGNDAMTGGADADVYRFAAASAAQTDTLAEALGGGADTLNFAFLGSGVPVTVNLGSDTLATHANRTVKTAAAGTSKFFDNAVGGAGNDALTGNNGGNVLTGNAGADKLLGLAGIDTLLGGAGDDTLDGGDNSDALDGGANNDKYVFTPAVTAQTDTIAELTGGGTDTLDFSALAATDPVTVNLLSDTLATHARRTVKTKVAGQFKFVENVTGGKGNDKIAGNDAVNKLVGGLGNDTLTGGKAADSMYGNEGADKFFAADTVKDFLDGGAGTDSLGSSDGIDTKVNIP